MPDNPEGKRRTMIDRVFYRMWKLRIQSIPQLQRFHQVGIVASYPVLVFADTGLHTRHFYYAGQQIGPDTVQIGPPQILVTLDYTSNTVLNVEIEPFEQSLFAPIEYTLSANERTAHRPDVAHLEELYDRLLETYPAVPGGGLMNDFTSTLQRVVPPVLWPCYTLMLGDMATVSGA